MNILNTYDTDRTNLLSVLFTRWKLNFHFELILVWEEFEVNKWPDGELSLQLCSWKSLQKTLGSVNAFSCGRLKSFPEGRSTNVQIIQNLSKRKASPPHTIVYWKANSKSLSAYNFSMRFLRSQQDANESNFRKTASHHSISKKLKAGRCVGKKWPGEKVLWSLKKHYTGKYKLKTFLLTYAD